MDYSNIQATLGLAAKLYVAADDDDVGPVIDLAGFRKAWVVATLGVCGENASVFIQTSDDGVTFAIPEVLNAIVLNVANSTSVQSTYIDTAMQKRYMRLIYNHTGAAETHAVGVTVMLGNPENTTLVTHVPGYVEEAHNRN